MFEYDTLRIIWWLLLGVLLTGFAIMDGFDFGAAMLLPFTGKNDTERRIVLNTIGPVWEGNQVWFILGGGAIFAAWPILYAVAFSGFYFAMLILLLALIMRPVAFKFRSKLPHVWWRHTWDWILAASGFVAALIFGVALGNVLQGVPYNITINMMPIYEGSFIGLLNPFAILTGLISVAMMITQGALYLAVKTESSIRERAIRYSRITAMLTLLLFALAGYLIANHVNGYTITSKLIANAPSNPHHKEVAMVAGGWLRNYSQMPWLLVAPMLGFIGAIVAILFANVGRSRFAFIGSSLSIAGIVSTAGVSMFPFLLPSSNHPNISLLVWDASSSQYTLGLILFAMIVFMPIILIYTSWVFYVLRGKLTEAFFNEHEASMY